jgi:hypothetical protein
MAMNMPIVDLWFVTPCSIVDGYQRFQGIFSSTLKMGATYISETLVTIYQFTRWHNLEDFALYITFDYALIKQF